AMLPYARAVPLSYLLFFHRSGDTLDLPSFPTRRSSDLLCRLASESQLGLSSPASPFRNAQLTGWKKRSPRRWSRDWTDYPVGSRSEEHTSELQSRFDLVCRLLLEKKKKLS